MMRITPMPALRRAVAIGGAAAVLASVAVVETGAPALADEAPIAGLTLPVPATDVTETDPSLGSVAREVVVTVPGEDGAPVVRKLKARTQAEATVLAEELNAEPGVVAQVNQVTEAPEPPRAAGGAVAKPDRRIRLGSGDEVRAQAVRSLGAEQFGAQQWGLAAVGAESAWQVTRGAGVTVAIVDSGVDATHPDLAGRVLPQIDMVDDSWTGDPDGHGTHVAGIVAASLDGAGVAGLANEVRVLPVRVLDASGSGDSYTTAAGIIEAVNTGAKVVNLSFGGGYHGVEAEAVQYAVSRGVTVVASGGNKYQEGNPVNYPAAYSGVLGVSSVDSSGRSSWFANSGSYIDISAPGEDILSTVPGSGWEYADGTSMAAPFVSAAAALVRVANPALSKAQVDDVLLSTARDDANGDGPDTLFGHGILQSDQAALKAAQAPGGSRAPAAQAPAAVKVRATGRQSKLRVDVDPNRGRGYWTFQVQRLQADGSWQSLKSYRTLGSRETRTINLRRGTYRVMVKPKYGFAGTTSGSAYLKR